MVGDQISWPIDALVKGDVYVADCFGKIEAGPIVRLNSGLMHQQIAPCRCTRSLLQSLADGVSSQHLHSSIAPVARPGSRAPPAAHALCLPTVFLPCPTHLLLLIAAIDPPV